jgi:hypothetical protein
MPLGRSGRYIALVCAPHLWSDRHKNGRPRLSGSVASEPIFFCNSMRFQHSTANRSGVRSDLPPGRCPITLPTQTSSPPSGSLATNPSTAFHPCQNLGAQTQVELKLASRCNGRCATRDHPHIQRSLGSQGKSDLIFTTRSANS